MFKITFSTVNDVIAFVDLCGMDALNNVKKFLDHQSAEVVDLALKQAKQTTLRVDVKSINTENNNIHQWVDIDLVTLSSLAYRDIFRTVKGLLIQGDHAGDGLVMTTSQFDEVLDQVEDALRIIQVING